MQAEAVYQTLFWTGVLGVAVMGAMGAASHGSNGGHHGHDAAHHHEGSGHGHAAHHAPAHQHSGDAHGHGSHHGHHHDAHVAATSVNVLTALLGVLSPMTLFAASLGAGATGILLGSRFSVGLTAILALLGGLAIVFCIVRPLMAFTRRFVSTPAQNLAGVVATEAVAQNRFDATGRGIVNVTLDGQIVRLLAYQESDDVREGLTINPGDVVVVTAIDETRNTCRVTKL